MFGVATMQNIFSSLLRCSAAACLIKQPARGVIIFKRMYPPRLHSPKATGPFRPKLRRAEYIYVVEENTNSQAAGDMDVILATDIEGLGFQGDIVTVSKRLARNHMLPVGVAEYVSPGNLGKYEQIRKEREDEKRQTMTAHKTMKQLQTMTLPIPMSSTDLWTLTKTHVKVAFRICGVELSEEQIILPDEPVTEAKEIVLKVTVNGLHSVPVQALVYLHNKAVTPTLPRVWTDSPAAEFDIYRVISAAAHHMRGLSYKQDESIDASTADLRVARN